MNPDIEPQRRALAMFYRRYVMADRAWQAAQREALSWFPGDQRRTVPPIGNPGSSVRRLYERRDRALSQLVAARIKLDEARRRTARRVRVLLLTSG